MKRNMDFEDEMHQIGPNKTFRISPESTLSSNINNHSATLPTNFSTNTNTNNVANANKGTSLDDDDNSSNNNNNKEHDRFLPIANVGRIMKKIIPGNGKISKDAKETVQECVSEFISFVTGEASEKCQREKRKTINGDDILWAIMTLGFEDYVSPLKIYLTKYREVEGEKLNVPKQQCLEQPLQHQQKPDESCNSVYSSTNLIPQPSFLSTDPSFTLPFSQNSIQTTSISPQQSHFDGSW